VTADHDHTLVLNGYAKRTGKTSATNPGVLGLVKNYADGSTAKDADGAPFSIIGFGNGENRTGQPLADGKPRRRHHQRQHLPNRKPWCACPRAAKRTAVPTFSSARSARARTPSPAPSTTRRYSAWL
jgi:hypothetical protein